jgi:predicted site-specific integrase-resolvase
MTHYRDENEARIDELCKPIPLADVLQHVHRVTSKRTIDRWIKAGRLRVVHLTNPPEDVVILRELLETEKAMRDALAASKAAIAARAGHHPQTPTDTTDATS